MKRLETYFQKLTAASFARYGFAYGDLLTRWVDVAGPDISQMCRPKRIKWPRQTAPQDKGDKALRSGGTLVLEAAPGRALELRYHGPLIIERVNRFYGFAAIMSVSFVTSSDFNSKVLKLKNNIISAADQEAALNALPEMEDDGLRQALARLGAHVKSTPPTSPQG